MSSDTVKKHLGIPEAKFVDDVEKYMADQSDSSAEKSLQQLDQLYQKYKMMDFQLNTRKTRLKAQIPDLKTSLDIVKHLNDIKDEKKTMETHFLLSGALRAKATVPPAKEVGLWLGANIMLMYGIDDAHDLLSKNIQTATKNLESVNDDLDYLRDQCTTTEVSMARVYNWDVMRRKASKGEPSK